MLESLTQMCTISQHNTNGSVLKIPCCFFPVLFFPHADKERKPCSTALITLEACSPWFRVRGSVLQSSSSLPASFWSFFFSTPLLNAVFKNSHCFFHVLVFKPWVETRWPWWSQVLTIKNCSLGIHWGTDGIQHFPQRSLQYLQKNEEECIQYPVYPVYPDRLWCPRRSS